MRLNGRDVEASGTLLDVCRRHGVAVPTACFDDRVRAGGHCRLCMVEVDGSLQSACTTPARDGIEVRTETGHIAAYRRDLGELMLAESSPAGRIAPLLASFGADGSRYAAIRPIPRALLRRDDSHPLLRIDTSACILCRLCIDVCADIQGAFVWTLRDRGGAAHVDWGDGPFAGTACVACGACAAVCPTSAITDVDRLGAGATATTPAVRTTCPYCGVGCQLDVSVAGGDVVLVEGVRAAVNDGHLCVKGRYAHSFARHRERLTTPLLRRGGKLVPASWDEAIEFVASGLRRLARVPGQVAALSSSRCTNEENYLLQKWMRAGLGTNDVDCCARVCHAPSAAGMRRAFGLGAATNSFEDIEKSDLLLVCGANATESHPVVGARIVRHVLAGGCRLVVIDPRRTDLAALADVHLAPRPGTNVPLLNSLAAVIVEEGLADREFVRTRAEGFEELARFLADKAPERTESLTGVPAALVRDAARRYARARAPMQLHGLGVTEHYQGSESVMLLCNLAVLAGAVGREGVGVNPLRGQNNVQGAADMGCQPDLLTGYAPVASAEARVRFEAIWQRPVPPAPGRTIPRIYEAIDRGEVRGLFILGEDVAATDPASDEVRRRLSSLELLVVEEIFLSETARLAHVVLPGASAFEKDGTFTNAERRVQRVRCVLPPPGDALPDWRILVRLMRATGMEAPYETPQDIFEEIRRVWPALDAATWASLGADGLQWPAARSVGTPVLHREGFGGASGPARARLHCVDYAASPDHVDSSRPLALITGRVLEHYNSGSMTRRSELGRLVGEDCLEMHPADARARGIADGDEVVVQSEGGSIRVAARLTESVREGSLFLSFHFPETGANRLTSGVVDRVADCPEYKLTPVEVSKA